MKKATFTPIKIANRLMIPVTRFYSLQWAHGKDSVRQAIADAVAEFGALYQGETDIRRSRRERDQPVETGYCHFLIPAESVNDFNAHWDRLAEEAERDGVRTA